MSFFLCCLRTKRKKSVENYSASNEQLPRASSKVKQTVQASNIHTSKISHQKQLKKSKASMRHSVVKNQGYSEITNLATGLNMYVSDDELNFRMDNDDGISHNLTINTFHYEVQNDQPGFLYYQNVGLKGFQQKQIKQTKKSKSKEKPLKREGFDLHDKNDEMPTSF